MINTTFIYALVDPRSSEIRYVGKANNPARRLVEHFCAKDSSHTTRWLRQLRKLGIRPLIEVLDEVPKLEWELWEREYIRLFRMLGFKLTNTSDGGDGPLVNGFAWNKGLRTPPEIRAKLRASHLGQRAWNKGRKSSAEERAKMSKEQTGKIISATHRLKLSLANKGRRPYQMTDTIRGRMSDKAKASFATGRVSWMKGKRHSDESKRKLALASTGPRNRNFGVPHWGANKNWQERNSIYGASTTNRN